MKISYLPLIMAFTKYHTFPRLYKLPSSSTSLFPPKLEHFPPFLMSRSLALSDAITLFRSDLQNKMFGDRSLRFLETILVAKDVEYLVDARSSLQEILRSESVSIMREIVGRNVEEKLDVAEFFVKAFALVGDAESCLALKYEAFVLRELKHASNPFLQVSYEEWTTFAEDSFSNRFYSIAVKGYDNALLCIQSPNEHRKHEFSFNEEETVKQIKQKRDMALAMTASNSVKSQTAEYLKKKDVRLEQCQNSSLHHRSILASSMFRNGIKKRNIHKLRQKQALPKDTY